jgi:predicted helicase
MARLHLEYESLDEWPLEWIETPGVPLSYRVEKMKLSKDKTALAVNPSLTLALFALRSSVAAEDCESDRRDFPVRLAI